MKTLTEMNESRREWEWSNEYRLLPRYVVARMGWGTKTHLVSTDEVVGYVNGFTPRPGQLKVGSLRSGFAKCNTNTNKLQVVRDLDTKDVTCEKCRQRL